MERKDDIGEFINKKLGKATKVAPPNLWDRIDTTLEKRRKRRGLVFFWSGLAGLVLIGLLIGGLSGYFNTSEEVPDTMNETLFSSEGDHEMNTNNSMQSASEMTTTTNSNELENSNSELVNNTYDADSKKPDTSSTFKTTEEKAISLSTSEVKTTKTNRNLVNKATKLNTASQNNTTTNQNSSAVETNTKQTSDGNSQKSGIATGISRANQLVNGSRIQDANETVSTTYYYYDSASNKQFETKNKSVIDSLRAARAREIMLENSAALVKVNEQVVEKVDELKVMPSEEVPEPAILAVAVNKDSVQAMPQTNFSLSGHVVPLYFGPSQTESAIDRSLELNDKKGAWNLGFGIMANFRMNDNAMLSLGAYYSKVSYTTNNVQVGSQIQRDTILKYLGVNHASSVTSMKLNGFFSGSETGQLKQEVSYVEVPLQFNYIIPRGKFEFSMMGGFSTYFLLDDSLTLINESNQELTLGTSNNLSTVSLSLNAGIGFYYQLTPKLGLDVQPVFKYRIKTLNQASYNGETATFGILTGVRYRF